MSLPVVEWTEAAIDDLADIYDYIEHFNPTAAQELRDTITQGVASLLTRMPHLFRKGRIKGTREFVAHPNYLVVYKPTSRRIRILRVLHTKRKFPNSETPDGFPPRYN